MVCHLSSKLRTPPSLFCADRRSALMQAWGKNKSFPSRRLSKGHCWPREGPAGRLLLRERYSFGPARLDGRARLLTWELQASASSVLLRQKVLKKCREDIYHFLDNENGQVAIYDAVNPLSAGRKALAKEFAKRDILVRILRRILASLQPSSSSTFLCESRWRDMALTLSLDSVHRICLQ